MSPDSCLSIHMYLRNLCKIHVSGSVYKHPYVSQDSCLSIHMYLRNLCKIHVFGSVYKHPYVSQGPLQDPCLRIHVSASICISGTSARSMSPDPYISIHMYLRILCEIHVSRLMSQHPYVSQEPLQDPCLRLMSQHLYISGSSARSMSPDSCLSIFISQDPLQDPCLRIQISASICISGSSARSMSPGSSLSIFASQDPLQDPCLRIHVSDSCLGIHQFGSSARSMSPDSCLSIFVSQDSLQDPCLRIHVSASTNMDPLQDPRLRIHVSASLYLRLFCKIHVSGSVYKHPYVPQDPLQDPCLRIHVSASICISGTSARSMSPDPLHLRILYKIHVFGSMSQHLYISGASARSMSPIHVLASLSSDFVALRRRNANFALRRRVLCGPAQGKQSDRVFCAGETQILTCRDAFLWPCAGETQIWPPKTRLVSISCGFTRSHDQMNENRHGATARRKKKLPSQFWPPEARFLWPCAGKTAEARNLHLDLRGFTPTVRTPQCATLFGELNPETFQTQLRTHHFSPGDQKRKYITKLHLLLAT